MGYLSLKLLYELVTAHNSFYNYWVGCITRAFNAGLLSSLWKTDHGLEGAKLDRLSEFSRICGLGTEHKSRRAFSFWSERKRPVTGAREWSDVPTGSEHPGVVLWWHFRQHLCKLILNLLMIIIININTLTGHQTSAVLAQLRVSQKWSEFKQFLEVGKRSSSRVSLFPCLWSICKYWISYRCIMSKACAQAFLCFPRGYHFTAGTKYQTLFCNPS